MSLTVADVLALAGLESMGLRAGQPMQNNPVRWPYVAENSSIAEWIMGGELVFITGINHPRSEENLLLLVRQARQRAAAGLVILTGPQYIKEIPQSVIEAAQQLGVPLIEQPYSLKMVVVTQAIGTALVQAQLLGRSRQHLLEQLLEGDVHSLDSLLQRAHSLGLPLTTARQVALLKLEGSRHEPVLMPTLEAWFHESGNLALALAAQRLGVHRNTMSYRTQRIETLTGSSFSNPHDRLNISIALLIWRLSSSRPARSTA